MRVMFFNEGNIGSHILGQGQHGHRQQNSSAQGLTEPAEAKGHEAITEG